MFDIPSMFYFGKKITLCDKCSVIIFKNLLSVYYSIKKCKSVGMLGKSKPGGDNKEDNCI